MFFNKKKDEALIDHKQASKELEDTYSEVMESAKDLNTQKEAACELIQTIEEYINQMTRTPKTIDRKIGEINVELSVLKKTEEYAQEAYNAAVKSGLFTVGGVSAGIGMTVMSSSEWKNLTTTFGRENADRVLKTISKMAETRKVALLLPLEKIKKVWKKVYQHLGIIGIGVTAASLAIGMAYVSYSNLSISKQLTDEIIEIDNEIYHLKKKCIEIKSKKEGITKLMTDLEKKLQKLRVLSTSAKYGDYGALNKHSRDFLKTYMNKTYSLAKLLNDDVK